MLGERSRRWRPKISLVWNQKAIWSPRTNSNHLWKCKEPETHVWLQFALLWEGTLVGSHVPARQSQSHGDKAPELTLQHWRFQHFLVKKKIWRKNAMSNYLQIWLSKVQNLVAALGFHERLSPAPSNPNAWSSRVEPRSFQTRAGTVLPLVPRPLFQPCIIFGHHYIGLACYSSMRELARRNLKCQTYIKMYKCVEGQRQLVIQVGGPKMHIPNSSSCSPGSQWPFSMYQWGRWLYEWQPERLHAFSPPELKWLFNSSELKYGNGTTG